MLPLGDESPRDLYVSWPDFKFQPGGDTPDSPLGNLAYLVMSGATVVDSPRVPASTASAENHLIIM